uniref:Endoplasmic reticulum vesicle transporter C-terminal domain-containing protein n=1 Tax=Chlamydomonas leiostraca TaxID=1034604 RepID=A0A7S0RFI5_9CHLO|mmetsp:Transcript_21234/g.53995  ORF Transcript_21234/g.53995 Transcript_21234/m.53995 type:complete len:393 (+) Transcript_21234:107-1285(+)
MSSLAGSGGGLLSKLAKLDAYPKLNEDFSTKTMSGGVITIASSVVMLLLFISEVRIFTALQTTHELVVDTSRGETITINVDVTFPRMPCAWLSLDTMDISGDLHLDVDHDVYKQRLDAKGNPIREAQKHDVHSTKHTAPPVNPNVTCASCYGAEEVAGQCCNTCDEVRAAYRKKGWALTTVDHIEQCKHDEYMDSIKEQVGEGCKIWGRLEVNKVAGNFHFAPGRSYQQGNMHVHDVAPFGDAKMDFSHTINSLSFGTSYPGMRNPLDNVKAKQPQRGDDVTGMFQYFLKVVPTSYTTLTSSKPLSTNQFSVTENFREGQGGPGRMLPGVFFFYDLSPIKVQIVEKKSSFMHFLTSVCAIVGGVFTISGILDAGVYQGERLVKKKMQLGKFS